MKREKKASSAARVKLRPANPFDLIRWLARSQSDPRKAVAELVQNSLDAGATHIVVERRRMRGVAVLLVRDDGEGVLPELQREAALRYLAEHIGHSRKLKLSPAERHSRVIAGKYGVGLLGFWSIGHRFEMRSRVGGGKPWALRLVEELRDGEVVSLPLRTDDPATFTEIVVSELHEAALRPLGGARLSIYLGAELRGQLLARSVELTVVDRMARGLAQQRFDVRPRRFVGERLDLPAEITVVGFEPMRVELYFVAGGGEAAIQVACAGTLVADDIAELSSLGLAEAPWVGRGLAGVVDFPDLNIPPGTRRGVVPDAAAASFVAALALLHPLVEAELKRLERERQTANAREVVRDLRAALRGFSRQFPEYELPTVADGGERAVAPPPPPPGGVVLDESELPPANEPLPLFPPGPLTTVRIVPEEVTISPGGERRVRAEARDRDGVRLREGVDFAWSIDGSGITIIGERSRPALAARADVLPGVTATLVVTARAGEQTAAARAPVTVIDAGADSARQRAGIPDPELVADAAGDWRSRLADG
ncbi:MAG: ATP-binding protein, partial [Myxococcales bacterium]|nr:ATP-binding protein [Myxococcales bacterium]